MWPTNSLPALTEVDFAARGAGRVFDQWEAEPVSDGEKSREVTRHSELVHAQDSARARCDRRVDQDPVDVAAAQSALFHDNARREYRVDVATVAA